MKLADQGFTEDEIAGMPEAERLALEADGDDDDDDDDAPAASAADDTDAGDPAEDDAGDAPAAAEPEAVAADEPETEAIEQREFVPTYPVADVSGIEQKLTALEDRFENGELTMADYSKQRDSLVAERTKAELKDELNQDNAKALWDYQQKVFFEEHGPSYKDPGRSAMLNAYVIQLANDPANTAWTGAKVLNKAHEMVLRQLGDAQAPAPAAGKPNLKAVPKPRTDLKTLGGLPAAEQTSTGENEFAALDKLSGAAYENALAAMSPAAQSRYLSAA